MKLVLLPGLAANVQTPATRYPVGGIQDHLILQSIHSFGSGWVNAAHLWAYGPTRYREVVLTC